MHIPWTHLEVPSTTMDETPIVREPSRIRYRPRTFRYYIIQIEYRDDDGAWKWVGNVPEEYTDPRTVQGYARRLQAIVRRKLAIERSAERGKETKGTADNHSAAGMEKS